MRRTNLRRLGHLIQGLILVLLLLVALDMLVQIESGAQIFRHPGF